MILRQRFAEETPREYTVRLQLPERAAVLTLESKHLAIRETHRVNTWTPERIATTIRKFERRLLKESQQPAATAAE